MERLTERHYQADGYYMACSENCNEDISCIICPAFERLVDRLGAYEDTGLTPEEVNALKASEMVTVPAMGVVDFLMEKARMCLEYDKCNLCPIGSVWRCVEIESRADAERLVAIVEAWKELSRACGGGEGVGGVKEG